jgi:alanine racemase
LVSSIITTRVQERTPTRPTWCEVSLCNLRENIDLLREHFGDRVSLCALMTGDAFGHGALECARVIEQAGIEWLGVSSLDEATALRSNGLRARVLLINEFFRDQAEEIIRFRVTPTVSDHRHVILLQKAASKLKVTIPIHLNLDILMGDSGTQGLQHLLCSLSASPNVVIEAITDRVSFSVSKRAYPASVVAGRRPPIRFISASFLKCERVGAFTRCAVMHPMERIGLALFGLSDKDLSACISGAKPVLTWKTRIWSMRELAENRTVGYGGTYRTAFRTRVAVVPVGYADGLNRALSSAGRVIIRNDYAPIIGRISMDITLIDVTHIPGVLVGDEVILLGPSQKLAIHASEHAAAARTVVEDILCRIGKRVPRLYKS